MRSMAHWLIGLYPARWRARYGEEFAALIEDSSPGPAGIFDLFKGALKMRLSVPSFPKLAVILSVTGLVAGLGVSMLVTPRYISSAEMQLMYAPLAPSARRQNLHERLMNMEQEILSRTSLAGVIQDPRLDLYGRAREHTPLEDVIEQMRTRDIKIQALGSGGGYVPFAIRFIYPDRIKARDTVQALVTKFIDINLITQRTKAQVKQTQAADRIYRLEERVAALEKRLGVVSPPHRQLADEFVPQLEGVNLEVVDPASLPVNPAYPNRSIFAAIGFGGGFVTAILIAIFRRTPPPIPFPAQTV